jgi:hypothetical protein
MKQVKIGNKEYNQIESIFDIGDERFVVFKQHLLQVFENVNNASFLQMHNRITKYFNANDSYQIIVELENFKKSLELRDLNYDAFSFCFALLHLEKEEKQNDFGGDYQLRKLEEMRKNGLNRGQVEDVVENFMKASPKHFGHYLEVLQVLNSFSKEEISSALQN